MDSFLDLRLGAGLCPGDGSSIVNGDSSYLLIIHYVPGTYITQSVHTEMLYANHANLAGK